MIHIRALYSLARPFLSYNLKSTSSVFIFNKKNIITFPCILSQNFSSNFSQSTIEEKVISVCSEYKKIPLDKVIIDICILLLVNIGF